MPFFFFGKTNPLLTPNPKNSQKTHLLQHPPTLERIKYTLINLYSQTASSWQEIKSIHQMLTTSSSTYPQTQAHYDLHSYFKTSFNSRSLLFETNRMKIIFKTATNVNPLSIQSSFTSVTPNKFHQTTTHDLLIFRWG